MAAEKVKYDYEYVSRIRDVASGVPLCREEEAMRDAREFLKLCSQY